MIKKCVILIIILQLSVCETLHGNKTKKEIKSMIHEVQQEDQNFDTRSVSYLRQLLQQLNSSLPSMRDALYQAQRTPHSLLYNVTNKIVKLKTNGPRKVELLSELIRLTENLISKIATRLLFMLLLDRNCENEALLLIERVADINAGTNGLQATLLAHAIAYGASEAVIRSLIGRGADVNAQDIYQRTVLMYAIDKDISEAVIRLLIERGANVNAQDNWARTPLMIALQSGRTDVISLLISAGAELPVYPTIHPLARSLFFNVQRGIYGWC